MLGASVQSPPPAVGPSVYRPRRPAATLLHKTVREHLEAYLVTAECDDDLAANVPFHVQAAFREYLKCGILAHGFARVYCSACKHDFMVAFSCKGRDICPSCSTRRMVETTVRQRSGDAPAGARFGAVAFVHRFGGYLNSHVHSGATRTFW